MICSILRINRQRDDANRDSTVFSETLFKSTTQQFRVSEAIKMNQSPAKPVI